MCFLCSLIYLIILFYFTNVYLGSSLLSFGCLKAAWWIQVELSWVLTLQWKWIVLSILCAACAVHCSGLLSHVARYEVVTPQRLAARQKRSLQDSEVSSSHLTVWLHRNFIRDQNPIYSQTVWWLLQKRSGRMVWISYRHFCPSEGCEYLYVLSDDWWTVFHSFTLIQSGTSWLSKGGITLFIWKKTGIWKTNSHLYDTFCI